VFRDGAPDHPTDPAQPGESVQQAGERADRVLAYVSKVHQETHKDVVAVTHGHFSRVLIARFLKLPVSVGASFQMSTTGAAVLSYDHSCWEEPTLLGMFAPSLRPTAFLPSALDPKHEEYQYLDLVDEVIRCGEYRADRTGTGTRAIFAPQLSLEFDLTRGTLPLLTTKRVFVRGVIEELLWFISGKTDAKLLADRGVHIWDGNGSRDFLAQRGLGHRREGDLGPVYGFQWRHFGAQYVDADTDYTGQGVDQLANVIHAIKTNPTDRRILLTAWNPVDLSIMALPPCHILCQFFVSMREGQRPCLECQMYQRSCDLGLGVPFNIASYALLTHLIAAVTGCEASKFSLVLGDAHVYMDHIEPLKEQLKRAPRDFPKVHLKREVSNIDDIRPEDIDIQGYQPHGKIEMRMSV
jgi:thymidylate synthase